MTGTKAEVRAAAVDGALAWLADADLDQIVKALTPEIIARDLQWSASTIRYHFRGSTDDAQDLAFRRRDLGLAMLEAALEAGVQASGNAAAQYAGAAEALPDTDAIDDVLAVLAANLDAFIPGATADDVSPRERMYFLALVVCDTDSDVARLLRTARARQIAGYEPMYRLFIERMGRELLPGRTVGELAGAIYALLDGHLTRLRFEPHASGAWLGDTVVAVFAAFTAPRGRAPRDVRAALLGRDEQICACRSGENSQSAAAPAD